MSHYTCLVIVPGTMPAEDIPDEIGRLLERYDENREVPEYDRPCYCLGQQAEREVAERLDSEFGLGWNTLRLRLEQEIGEPPKFEDQEALNAWMDRRQTRWEELYAPREEGQRLLLAAHPLNNQPDPTCEECHGSGTYRSTYNPDSKWDWWTIGGRWYGAIRGQEETSDDGFNWSLSERPEILKLVDNSLILRDLDPNVLQGSVYSIITPDGTWHAEGRMGWWGIDHDKQPDWPETKADIIAAHIDHRGVLLDLHI